MTAPQPAEVLGCVAVVFAAAVATAAVRTRDPVRQAVVLSALGLVLALVFTLFQAPDVALSQLAVGTAVTPLLILLTVRTIARRAARRTGEGRDGGRDEGRDGGRSDGRDGGRDEGRDGGRSDGRDGGRGGSGDRSPAGDR
ncbi:Na(+)/H(+) antiporter subunit B [Streptomyces sp. NPDC101160]|uniref:Na(+)/H(+) antiporter subunit B n=1 Tax=Streptomyces sp. NPDC101160 TaxID=3366118 RepID=UPI00382AC83E